ncbi:MAG: type II secretion system F family protein [Gemmatimonadota bacterium]
MPAFAYHAVDPRGKRHRGTEEAASPLAVTRVLEGRGLLVLEVAEQEARAARGVPGFGRRRAVLEATRALASLLAAGLPLSRALGVTEGLVGPGIATSVASIRSRIERGDALHAALADYPHLFPPLHVGVVRAGEQSGDLAGAFRRLEAQLGREQALRSRLVSASIYPAILAVVGGFAVVLLALFVVPRFADLLQDAGATLPTSTRALLTVSRTALRVWPALVLGPPLLVLFAAVLVGGGASLLDALESAAGSVGDPEAAEEAVRVRLRVREGASFHAALAEGSVFPELLPRLVGVGEESGRLEEFLGKAAELFETRVSHAAERLASLAEPAMILVFGALVGLVALAMLQAIYGVNAGAFR